MKNRTYIVAFAKLPNDDYTKYMTLVPCGFEAISSIHFFEDLDHVANWIDEHEPESMWYWVMEVTVDMKLHDVLISGAMDPDDADTIRKLKEKMNYDS